MKGVEYLIHAMNPTTPLRIVGPPYDRGYFEVLREAAKELRPFPPFPGAFFTNAIEVNLEGVERPDIGCIVVAEDGELYELEMQIDFGDEFGHVVDPVQAREEKLKKLEDLHPRDVIVLAYNALSQLTELLLERADA